MAALTGDAGVGTADGEAALPPVIEPGRRPEGIQDVTALAIASVGPLGELLAVKRTVAVSATIVPGFQSHRARFAPGLSKRARQRRRVELRVAVPAGDREMGALEPVREGLVPVPAYRRRAEGSKVVAGHTTTRNGPDSSFCESALVGIEVTGLATGVERQPDRLRVARGALDLGVPPQEIEFEVGMIGDGERTRAPALDAMAGLAGPAVGATSQVATVPI